jgi:acetyl-CoA carboxylase biotin carboxyl carrier protein
VTSPGRDDAHSPDRAHRPRAERQAATPPGISAADLASLLALLAGTDLEELEVQHGENRLLVRRDPARPPAPAPTPPGRDALRPADEGAEAFRGDRLLAIRSTLVGLFFRGGEPGAEPLAREGDAVRAGQPLATIEALRVPHAVESPADGTLERVLVEDGHPVEYGQPVMLLHPSS